MTPHFYKPFLSNSLCRCITLFGRPGSKKPFQFLLSPGQWWEVVLNVRLEKGAGEGAGGGTVWAARGAGGRAALHSHGVNFSFTSVVNT